MDIILQAREMLAEATSPHTDGYLRAYLIRRLIMLKELLEQSIPAPEIKGFKAEVKDYIDEC
jgi:hypothetical protein